MYVQTYGIAQARTKNNVIYKAVAENKTIVSFNSQESDYMFDVVTRKQKYKESQKCNK